MATDGSYLSEDQFLCSVCLEVFTEPVSIPCGHNFCKACISRHWEGKEQCQCPLCNEKFNRGLKLRVNTAFREIVENFKERHVIAHNNSPVKPGQVVCDCCLGNKFRASKTCLVCLTSYCETHLEPHRRVASLQRHKLTNPVHNLEEKICKTHNRIMELCRKDMTRVCVLCTEHSAHDTVPLEEAYVDKGAHIGKKKAEVGPQEIKQRRGKKGRKTTGPAQTKSEDKNEGLHTQWFPIDEPQQFNRYGYGPVDIFQGISDYEVQTTGRASWGSGEPRRVKSKFTPNLRNGNGIIRNSNSRCRAPHTVPSLFMIQEHERVTGFVDYNMGLVFLFPSQETRTLGEQMKSWAKRLRNKVRNIDGRALLYGCCCMFLILLISIWQIWMESELRKIRPR